MGTTKTIVITACAAVALVSQLRADQTTVSMDSGSQTVFNQGSTPLSGGLSNVDGDGFVLQLGYFSGSTATFTGNWIPLTGNGSTNAAPIPDSSPAELENQTSIGDVTAQGGTTGQFFLPELDFVSGSLISGNNLPAAGTQLGIRFYNNTTVATSTFYNTVTNSNWLWVAPATPPSTVNISLDQMGLLWESIVKNGQASNTAFHTTIPTAIPEPTTYALLGLGTLGLALVRRRRANKA